MGLTKAELEELVDGYEQLVDALRGARSIREVQEILDHFEDEVEDREEGVRETE